MLLFTEMLGYDRSLLIKAADQYSRDTQAGVFGLSTINYSGHEEWIKVASRTEDCNCWYGASSKHHYVFRPYYDEAWVRLNGGGFIGNY